VTAIDEKMISGLLRFRCRQASGNAVLHAHGEKLKNDKWATDEHG
jgi:hypothetical protein